MKRTMRGIAVVASAAALAITSSCGTALAVTGTIFKYTAPKTGTLSFHPHAFAPQASGLTYLITEEGLGDTHSLSCFVSAIHLPNGATVKAVAAWFSGVSGQARVEVVRTPVGSYGYDTLALSYVSDTTGVLKPIHTDIMQFATIDNVHYFYGLKICVDYQDIFHGAHITYTYTNAGD